MHLFFLRCLLSQLVFICIRVSVQALVLDVFSEVSIRNASSIVVYGLMKYYTGNQTGDEANLGLLPPPYFWWEAGAVWGGLIDYWHYTDDSSYNNVTSQAILSQISPTNDFMPPAMNAQLGNDDQTFWALGAMAAAEYDFPNPAESPSWLTLAINVFNDLVGRWHTDRCGGGLKWQIFESHPGYNYKNAIANGVFFQLSARLARYTGNQTYVEWAEKAWNWTRTIGLINSRFDVFDGTDDNLNCSEINHEQWSYNVGAFLYGSAMLYNYTNGSEIWTIRTEGLLGAAATFLSPFSNSTNIIYEPSCEESLTCNVDQQSFKAYLARWMGLTAIVAPFTNAAISEILRVNAKGASLSCSGGSDDVTCGSKWYTEGWDGMYGVGQQLSALDVIQALLLNSTTPPNHQANVHLSTPSITPAIPVPSVSPSTRPLFDQPSVGVKHLDSRWILTVIIGLFSVALMMMRC